MAHMMPSTCTARHAARPPRAQDCRTLVRLSSAWQKKQEIFEAIQRAAAAFGRRVTVAVAEDADLTALLDESFRRTGAVFGGDRG